MKNLFVDHSKFAKAAEKTLLLQWKFLIAFNTFSPNCWLLSSVSSWLVKVKLLLCFFGFSLHSSQTESIIWDEMWTWFIFVLRKKRTCSICVSWTQKWNCFSSPQQRGTDLWRKTRVMSRNQELEESGKNAPPEHITEILCRQDIEEVERAQRDTALR